MAKTIKDINQPTRKPTQVTDKTEDTEGRNLPMSVYLPRHEKEYIEALADSLGVSRHALLQFGMRYFIEQHRAGAVEVPIEKKTVTEIQST